MDQCEGGVVTAEDILDRIFSTVELIGKALDFADPSGYVLSRATYFLCIFWHWGNGEPSFGRLLGCPVYRWTLQVQTARLMAIDRRTLCPLLASLLLQVQACAHNVKACP